LPKEVEKVGLNPKCNVPCCDTADEMMDSLLKFALPAYYKLIIEPEISKENYDNKLKAALKKDLKETIQYFWRLAQINRRKDYKAKIMQQMGISDPKLFQQWIDMTIGDNENE